MVSSRPIDLPFFELDREQSRGLAASPSAKIEGFLLSDENRAFFSSRGINLDELSISGQARGEESSTKPPRETRRPLYSPLASTGQIRILKIEPGEGAQLLQCHLHQHSLQKPHAYDLSLSAYDALSYTWNLPLRTRYYTLGDPDPNYEFTPEAWLASAMSGGTYATTDGTPPAAFEPQADQIDEAELMRPVEILIDDTACDVNGNLAAALQHLRLPDRARNLWVDALCIDQQNLQERGEQVSQMDKIYQSADVVHVWLGPAADGSDRALVIAEAVWQHGCRTKGDAINLFRCEDTADKMTLLAAIEELTVLCMRPWFTRRWVAQELAFARHALVHCGSKTIEWQQLAYAVSFMQYRRLELTYMRIRELYLEADPKSYRRGYLNALAAETLSNMTSSTVRRLPSPSTHPVFERRADLESLLSGLAGLQCTNPLDTVYAMLAIASDTSVLCIGLPDYERPVREVYMQVVLRIVESKHCLNILCHRWAARDDSGQLNLPTWIQSFYPSATRHEGGADTSIERLSFVGKGRGSVFHAAGTRKKQGVPGEITDFEGVGRTLMVTGIIVDVIETVSPGAFKDIPSCWKDFAVDGISGLPTPDDAVKVRKSKDAFTTLSDVLLPAQQQTQAERYAAFADLLTAGSRVANSYTSDSSGPMCEALFAVDSPYRSSVSNGRANERDTSAVNIFEVRSNPDPAPLFHPHTGVPFPSSATNAFLTRTATTTTHRAIARTINGTLALVDALIPRAAPGDVIAVLIGCDVPVVLRPQSSIDFSATMSHGVFDFVGEAYVQGCMFGEAFEAAGRVLAEHGGERAGQRVGGIFLL